MPEASSDETTQKFNELLTFKAADIKTVKNLSSNGQQPVEVTFDSFS